MKISIPLKDIMIALGKRFDPAEYRTSMRMPYSDDIQMMRCLL